ncbi:MAG TPA: hypothetical protein VMF69_03940 [Gemmataceae bacterium]|nr:hypothetical protein [Gemmataceae bacterium]
MDSATQRGSSDGISCEEAKPSEKTNSPSASPPLLPLAPKLMLLFWMLLGAVAGVKLLQGIWRMAGWDTGATAIAVPAGAVAEAIAGGLIGRITRPSLLVLIMALLAGWSLGALAGGLVWAETGQFAGGSIGALVGGLTWTLWLLRERRSANQ